jgi:hypothetical protein
LPPSALSCSNNACGQHLHVLRKDELLVPEIEAARRGGYQLLLPDLALYELTKTPEWESTMRASVRLLAAAPEHASLAYGLKNPSNQERKTGLPSRDLIDRSGSAKLRQLMTELPAGEGALLEQLRPHWERQRRVFRRAPVAGATSRNHPTRGEGHGGDPSR